MTGAANVGRNARLRIRWKVYPVTVVISCDIAISNGCRKIVDYKGFRVKSAHEFIYLKKIKYS
jgi:hypothetical protein